MTTVHFDARFRQAVDELYAETAAYTKANLDRTMALRNAVSDALVAHDATCMDMLPLLAFLIDATERTFELPGAIQLAVLSRRAGAEIFAVDTDSGEQPS